MIISLQEWAKKVGLDGATARQKAGRGMLPAYKIGRIWVIDDETPNIDHREKEYRKKEKD